MKIIIIGVGALGSHAALAMRNIGQVTLIDFDRVEQKNVSSQFHSRMGLGRNKAQGFAQSMNGLFGVKMDAVPHRVVGDNIQTLIKGSALVLDCTDNGETRRLIQRTVREMGIPCLHGAITADGTFGVVLWDEHFTVDDETPGIPTCEDGAHLPFHMLVASQIAVTAQRFLDGRGKRNYHMTPNGAQRLFC